MGAEKRCAETWTADFNGISEARSLSNAAEFSFAQLKIDSLAGEGRLTSRSNAKQASVLAGAPSAGAAWMACFHCSLPVHPDTQYTVVAGDRANLAHARGRSLCYPADSRL